MPRADACSHCGYDVPASWERCPHCGLPGLFPNVRAAKEPLEVQALERRYKDAMEATEARGVSAVAVRFQEALAQSKAVMNRPSAVALQVMKSENEIYGTYYDLLRAHLRIPQGDEWDVLRVALEEALFPGYKEHIRFAALSVDGRGLRNYGDCSMVLRESMIAHRATVFQENCVLFMKRRGDLASGLQVPYGYRATWPERVKVCMAKKAHELVSDMQDRSFASLLLRPGPTSADDDFVEVHVYGPMTRRTFERVVLWHSPTATRADQTRLLAVKDTLTEAGIPVEEER